MLVRKNLRSKDRNVMSTVRFTCNMEILGGILRELFEEQGEECVNILARSNCIADRLAAVGIANIDRLVEENYGCIGVP